jgi:hypothetical protein
MCVKTFTVAGIAGSRSRPMYTQFLIIQKCSMSRIILREERDEIHN